MMTGSALAQQHTLTINMDASDPASKAAFDALIADFEAVNPDIGVVVNMFDHEGNKTAIRNFLRAGDPDLANWYAGNRMAPFINAGRFIDVSGLWEENGLGESLASAKASMTIDGRQWGAPYIYYQRGIYYNKDVYAQVGAERPANWATLVEPGYITANHAAIDGQDAAALLVQGKAANDVMGRFAVAALKDGGMIHGALGFMAFPEISPGIPCAEDAPTDTIHIPAGAQSVADAKKFLAFLATPDEQTKMNMILGQLPTNKVATVDQTDPFLSTGFTMLSESDTLAQLFDRGAPAEVAKAGFQEFMVKPERLEKSAPAGLLI